MSEELLNQIVNYGALGLIAIWFMIRMEKKMEDLTKAIQDLTTLINKVCDKIA